MDKNLIKLGHKKSNKSRAAQERRGAEIQKNIMLVFYNRIERT